MLKTVWRWTMGVYILILALNCVTLWAQTPGISFSPSSVDFGNVNLGTSSTQLITVTNTGSANLSITAVGVGGTNRLDFKQTNNCKKTVAPGGTCTITVTFTPALAGTRSATLSVTDNVAGSPQSISLTGLGAAPSISLSSTYLSFPGQAVGSISAAQAISVTNTGTATLTVTSITASGDFAQTNTCGTQLAAGAVCVINVTFSPTAIWTRSGTVLLVDNANLNPTQVVCVAGMGTGNGQLSFSPNSLSFGNQTVGTVSVPLTVTVTNTGSQAVTFNSIIASGDYSQTNTCGTSLNAGASCTVTATFAPTYASFRTGYLTFNDTTPSILQSYTLTGTGKSTGSPVAVTPKTASVTFTQTQLFSATINGLPSANVTWSVDSIVGGNTTVGTISTIGLYVPPATAGNHTITATNIANITQSANAPLVVTNLAGVFTTRYDNLRTSQNVSETVLNTGNVNQNQFGKLFSVPVDGYVYAQPLYVANVSIPGQGNHNVVYVATEYDSVYAFDADVNQGTSLWHTSFVNPDGGVTPIPSNEVEIGNDLVPWVGITATPVIDPASNTLFVVARTKEVVGTAVNYVQRLHALDITTGAERANSPVVIQATVAGTGSGSVGGQLPFEPLRQNNRAGLLLLNGIVYAGFSSLEDIDPFHGWILGYDENTLQQVRVFCTTPNGQHGGVWQGGDGLAADGRGGIFFTTADGTFDANTGGADYGDSVVRLTSTSGALAVADYFSPYNQAALASVNWDVGAGGTLLLPDQPGPYPHLLLAGGKGGTVYLANRDNLGRFNSTSNQILVTLPAAAGPVTESGGSRGGPGYWNGMVYYVGANDLPKQFGLYNGLLSATPIQQWTPHNYGYPGASPVVSANGNTNGVLWTVQTNGFATNTPAVLRAMDAANISRQIYYSSKSPNDTAGVAVKFAVPTVANGKVYLGTQTELDVYGLLP